MGAVDNGGGRACVGAEGKWEISLPSARFCSESKNAQSIENPGMFKEIVTELEMYYYTFKHQYVYPNINIIHSLYSCS